MNRNQRATRNNAANKPFISGGVMTNFTATPAQAMNLATAAVAPTPTLVQAQAINVGLNIFFNKHLFFLERDFFSCSLIDFSRIVSI